MVKKKKVLGYTILLIVMGQSREWLVGAFGQPKGNNKGLLET